jgi:iron complex outermembrane receptor protein
MASPALGQTAETPRLNNEEIVVTARRRAENILDVPISITTFSTQQLDRLSATSLRDVGSFVPNLHYSDRSSLQTEITIRGVGGDSRNIGFESGVGLYVDGVYAGRTSGYNLDLADVAQMEVLRGPQGILFGKNQTGGAINITTRRPGDQFEAEARASYGNYNAVRLKGSVSGPLATGISAKLTVATWDRDGYIENAFNGQRLQSEKRRAVMGQLRLQPSEALDILISADYTRDDQDTILNQLGSNAAFGAGFFNPDRFIVNTNAQNSAERRLWGVSMNADYTLGSGHVISSITAYRDVALTVFSDIDQTPLEIFRSGPFTDDAKQFSQELRIASPGSQFVDYVFGAFFYRQDADASRQIFQNGNPLFATSGPVDTTSWAGFGNVTFNFTPKLSVSAGARLTYEKRTGNYVQASPVPPLNKNFPLLEISSTEPTWTVAANYKWTDDISTYLTVGNGFKSGGFNVDPLATPAPLTAADITFKPEFVTSYEGGFKSVLMDGSVRLNGSIFFSKFTDRQVPQFETVGGVPTVITRNAGQSEVFGFELELNAFPTDWLRLSGGLGYLDGTYTQFVGATTGGSDFTGNKTEKTPQWTINLGADFDLPVGDGTVIFAPRFAYVGKTFLQPDNAPFNVEDGYALVNLRTGYEFGDGRYGIYLWARNLTNTQYKLFARQFAGSDQVLFGDPRTFGIEASVKF